MANTVALPESAPADDAPPTELLRISYGYPADHISIPRLVPGWRVACEWLTGAHKFLLRWDPVTAKLPARAQGGAPPARTQTPLSKGRPGRPLAPRRSLAGKLVDDICAAVGSQQCDFAHAEQLMAQLAEIRVADTACGSGGFLIKVLRCFWQQYQRIDQTIAWVQKILPPEDGELYLAELPPNVEAALGFRRRWKLGDRRELAIGIAECHLRCRTPQKLPRNVATMILCRGIIPLCAEALHFRDLTGTKRAFPDLRHVFAVN